MNLRNLAAKVLRAVVLCCVFSPALATAQMNETTYDTKVDVAEPFTLGRQFILFNQLLFGKGDSGLSVRRTYLPSDVETAVKNALKSSTSIPEADIDDTVNAWASAKLLIPVDNEMNTYYWRRIGVELDGAADWIVIDELPSKLVDTEFGRDLLSSESWYKSESWFKSQDELLGEYSIEVDDSGFSLYDENEDRVSIDPRVVELLFDLNYINSSGIGESARIALDSDLTDFRPKFFIIEDINLPMGTRSRPPGSGRPTELNEALWLPNRESTWLPSSGASVGGAAVGR